jgi:hypothetical protein
LAGVVAKPASINLRKWFISPTGSIKSWFHTEEHLPLCSSYLPLGVPNWVASTANHQLSCKISNKQMKHASRGVLNSIWKIANPTTTSS